MVLSVPVCSGLSFLRATARRDTIAVAVPHSQLYSYKT